MSHPPVTLPFFLLYALVISGEAFAYMRAQSTIHTKDNSHKGYRSKLPLSVPEIKVHTKERLPHNPVSGWESKQSRQQ